MRYNYLVVGAGLFGAVFARERRLRGDSVMVIDRRNTVGGNIYTENCGGIQVHRYGAHIFHTSDREVWDYVRRFAEFNHYINAPKARWKDELYDLPFNMNTFSRLWGVRTPQEAQEVLDRQRAEAREQIAGGSPAYEARNLEEQALLLAGRDIYEKLIQGYTEKQWGRPCTELPAFIIRRIPFRMVFDNNYFNDPYQGIPVGGYTALVENILEGIPVRTGIDFLEAAEELPGRESGDGTENGDLRERGDGTGSGGRRESGNAAANGGCEKMARGAGGMAEEPRYRIGEDSFDRVVYTGLIDEFFRFCYGPLEYRSLRFETEALPELDNYQGNAVINYTHRDVPYTRVIEHKFFEFGRDAATGSPVKGTIVTREYPAEWHRGDEPYYPVNNDRNNALYARYRELAEARGDVLFGGRLGQYRYYDMDQTIRAALDLARQL